MQNIIAQISLEQKIVLAGAGTGLTKEQLSVLGDLCERGPDWDVIFDFAKKQGGLFLFYKNLKLVREGTLDEPGAAVNR